jgi:protein SCO1/2
MLTISLSLLFLLQSPDSVLKQIGIDQKLGATIDPGISFRDESGESVKLAAFLGKRPVILTPVYYQCPMLCSMVLNGFVKALRVLPYTAGQEFEIITFSFDPSEQPDMAASKKQHYLSDYGRPRATAGWHFLTGDPEAIRKLADEIGFRYTYDADTKQWAHASGIVVLTPDGTISQYFYGIEYDPSALKLSVVQASNGKIGSIADRVLLFCFQYNPSTGRYSFAIMRMLRMAGLATVLLIAGFLFVESRRKRLA